MPYRGRNERTQRLRQLLRELHSELDPDAPRSMTTQDRALAVFELLGELAGGVGRSDDDSADSAAAASAERGRTRGARRGAQDQVRAASRGASQAGSNGQASARGLQLAAADDEPEPDNWADRFAKWLNPGS